MSSQMDYEPPSARQGRDDRSIEHRLIDIAYTWGALLLAGVAIFLVVTSCLGGA